MNTTSLVHRQTSRLGAPPIPREHGSWVLAACAVGIGAAAAPAVRVVPLLLLVLGVAAAMMARASLQAGLRRHPRAGARGWAAIWLTVAVGTAAVLAIGFSLPGMRTLAVAGIAYAGVIYALSRPVRGRRLDRTVWGEWLGAGGLALAAPAGYAVGGGDSLPTEAFLWFLMWAYSGSGIVYVKMQIAGLHHRELDSTELRRICGQGNLLYHLGLAAAVSVMALRGDEWLLVGTAFLPVIVRAFVGWWRLRAVRQSFVRVGLLEMAYSVWFAVWVGAAVRTL